MGVTCNLSMKQGSLFCFVCHVEIFQIIVLHIALLVSLESCQWVGVHWFGLRFFGAMVWKLLIIEPFSPWKLNKIETENYIGIWRSSWCCWKALDESDLIEFISQFSELRCKRYWFSNKFCCWKLKQITKIGFRWKNHLSPQCVHIGTMTHATLVFIQIKCSVI